MKATDELIEKLKELPIIYKAENTWKDTKWIPVTLKLVEIDKVIELIFALEKLTIKS